MREPPPFQDSKQRSGPFMLGMTGTTLRIWVNLQHLTMNRLGILHLLGNINVAG